MPDRLSSLDAAYTTGELSVFPLAIDSRDTLYEARNNAATTLRQSLQFSGKLMIVEDASGFPPMGLLRIGPPTGQEGNSELVYYGMRTNGTFARLARGFSGSRQGQWQAGATVTNAVMSEYHNALKDAVIQVEADLGLSGALVPGGTLLLPLSTSLNGILRTLEVRFLAPKPQFRAFPLKGTPALAVRFQNFSGGDSVRFLWDFGDGSSSTEQSPIHTYTREGFYSVRLSMITEVGAQGIAVKQNYIEVSEGDATPFFYVDRGAGDSIDTAGSGATTFEFVDQTDGPIQERIWHFGDGDRVTVEDPDVHTITHQYQSQGTYQPTLLVILENQNLRRINLPEPIQVS